MFVFAKFLPTELQLIRELNRPPVRKKNPIQVEKTVKQQRIGNGVIEEEFLRKKDEREGGRIGLPPDNIMKRESKTSSCYLLSNIHATGWQQEI